MYRLLTHPLAHYTMYIIQTGAYLYFLHRKLYYLEPFGITYIVGNIILLKILLPSIGNYTN